MSRLFTYPYRKPYRFLSLHGAKPERRSPAGHDRLSPDLYTGVLQVRLTTLSPVHVRAGDGEWTVVSGSPVPATAFYRTSGKVTIPGSSLRGVVRSVAEAVSYSCDPRVPRNFGDSRHRTPRRQPDLDRHNAGQCTDHQNLCPSCRLFGFVAGNAHYRGQVHFGDLVLETGSLYAQIIPRLETPFRNYPRQQAPDDVGGNERLYYCNLHTAQGATCRPAECATCTKDYYWEQRDQVKTSGGQRSIAWRGRKFYVHGATVRRPAPERTVGLRTGNAVPQPKGVLVEAVAPGATFSGEVRFVNCTERELQLLAFSLGIGNTLQLKVGYGKPVFLGSVQSEVLSIRFRTRQPENPDPMAWLNHLAATYDGPGVAELREILSWERRWQGIEPPDAPKPPLPVPEPDIY